MQRTSSRSSDLVRDVLRRTSARGDIPARALAGWDRRVRTGAGQTWAGVADVLVGRPPSRISVDVFDTVLSRRLLGDSSIFWITSTTLIAEGCWTGSPQHFVRARRAAARARPNGSLDDIYVQQPFAVHCVGGRGPRAEADAERQLVVAVPGAREALQRLRDAGHRLVFVSDMHLARPQLVDCLAAVGLDGDADELVISSEVGAAKWDGTLFPRLRAGSDPLRWHIGNDLWSDVAMAERAGVRALPIIVGNPTDLEVLMAGPAGSVGAAISGAARLARWAEAPGDPVAAAIREAGADVAGQCLLAFLLWIREQCREAGITQVVFLARDGQLPFRMASAMPPDHWAGFELQYVQGSRRLWSVAAAAVIGVPAWLDAGTSDDSSFVRQDQHRIPWRSLLARIALTPDDLVGHPSLTALPPDEPLPRVCDGAWRALLADEGIRASIADRARDQYENLCRHLVEEGLGTGRVAVVDVGWRGQLAWHVTAVLGAMAGHEPLHLHFGGVHVAPEAARVDIRRYAVDDSVRPPPFPDIVSCVETFTASGHARAHTLQEDGSGGVRLVFDAASARMDTAERRLLWEGALDVARRIPSAEQLDRWGLVEDDLDERVRQVLTSFWLSPSPNHALAAAHLAAEVDDAGNGIDTIASPYRLVERAGASRTWRQGSLRLTGPAVRHPLRVLLALRTLLRKTARVIAGRRHQVASRRTRGR